MECCGAVHKAQHNERPNRCVLRQKENANCELGDCLNDACANEQETTFHAITKNTTRERETDLRERARRRDETKRADRSADVE